MRLSFADPIVSACRLAVALMVAAFVAIPAFASEPAAAPAANAVAHAPPEAPAAFEFLPADSPASNLLLSDDGQWVLICHESADRVIVLDTRTGKPLATLAVPSPRTALARGGKIYVGSHKEGVIRQFDGPPKWEPQDEFDAGGKPLNHLSAASGEHFKGVFLASTGAGMRLVDVVRGEKKPLARRSSAAWATLDARGKRVLENSGRVNVFTFEQYLDERATGEGDADGSALLIGDSLWATDIRIYRGDVPRTHVETVQGKRVVGDLLEPIFYIFETTAPFNLIARSTEVDLDIIGQRVVKMPAYPKQFKDGLVQNWGYPTEARVAVTLDGQLYLYVWRGGLIMRAQMPAFGAAGQRSTAKPSTFTHRLAPAGSKTQLNIVRGPAAATIADGQLAWPLTTKDIGSYEIRYKSVTDGNVTFQNLRVEVAMREGVITGSVHDYLWRPLPTEQAVTTLAMSEDGRLLFLAHEKASKITVWNAATKQLVHSIDCPSPRHLISRGDLLLAACFRAGEVRAFSAAAKWSQTAAVKTGYRDVYHLSAAQGPHFKGLILATCEGPYNCSVELIDLNQKTSRVTRKSKDLSAATFSFDGRQVADQTGHGDPISRAVYWHALEKYLDEKKLAEFEKKREHPFSLPNYSRAGEMLSQPREGSLWLGERALFAQTGDAAPKKVGEALGDELLADATAPLCYAIKEKTITAIEWKEGFPVIGRREVAPPQYDPKDAQMRYTQRPHVYRRSVAVTRGGDVELFVFNPDYGRVHHIALPAFVRQRDADLVQSPSRAIPGRHWLSPGAVSLAPTHDRRGVLAVQGRTVTLLEPDTLKVLRTIELESPALRVIDRKDRLIAIGASDVAIHDRVTGKRLHAIDLRLTITDAAAAPPAGEGKTLYVAAFDPDKGSTDVPESHVIFTIDEAVGKRQLLPQILGEKIAIDPRGRFLFTALNRVVQEGVNRPKPDRVAVPRMATTEIITRFDLAGAIDAKETLEQRGGGVRSLALSPDGTMLLARSDRRPEFSTSEPGYMNLYNADNLKEKPLGKGLGSNRAGPDDRIVEWATHPIMPMMGVNDGRVVMLHPWPRGGDSKRIDIDSDHRNALDAIAFSPDGRRLLVAGVDAEGRRFLRSLKLPLDPKQEALVRQGPPVLEPAPAIAAATTSTAGPAAQRPKRAELQVLSLPGDAEMSPREVAAKFLDAVVVVKSGSGSGTGFFVSENGYVLTCAHVLPVTGQPTVHVRVTKGDDVKMTEVKAAIVSVDKERDLALLNVNLEHKPPTVRLESGKVEAGGKVVVIGHPGVGDKILDYTLTTGVVSSVDRTIEKLSYIQTSAAVNPGVSGGPLFNHRGNLIGVVVLKAKIEGAGFAVPPADILIFLEAAAAKKE